jgi:hypothetical protein
LLLLLQLLWPLLLWRLQFGCCSPVVPVCIVLLRRRLLKAVVAA